MKNTHKVTLTCYMLLSMVLAFSFLPTTVSPLPFGQMLKPFQPFYFKQNAEKLAILDGKINALERTNKTLLADLNQQNESNSLLLSTAYTHSYNIIENLHKIITLEKQASTLDPNKNQRQTLNNCQNNIAQLSIALDNFLKNCEPFDDAHFLQLTIVNVNLKATIGTIEAKIGNILKYFSPQFSFKTFLKNTAITTMKISMAELVAYLIAYKIYFHPYHKNLLNITTITPEIPTLTPTLLDINPNNSLVSENNTNNLNQSSGLILESFTQNITNTSTTIWNWWDTLNWLCDSHSVCKPAKNLFFNTTETP